MQSGKRGFTILVVEDEEHLRTVTALALQRAGYRVLEAGNGEWAIQLWNEVKGNIDLLVTDLSLGGGMNGDAVARKCRKTRPELPVIFASGNSQEANETDFDLVSHCRYLAKPYSVKALIEAVTGCLGATV